MPRIGGKFLTDVTKVDMRDLVRELRKIPDMAPRTVLHIYGDCRAMFRDACVEDLIVATPCMLAHHELPPKQDKDSEWRANAVYTHDEVIQLCTSDKIPAERRILNALKALTGSRHGEVAGLCWRHINMEMKPLGQVVIAKSYDSKTTKTGVTRLVPILPELHALLVKWRSMWAAHYGHEPTPDDLVAGTAWGTMVSASEGASEFKQDLMTLGLRVHAGESRDRGGHDLRAWFISSALEAGAIENVFRRCTHPGKTGDAFDGYNRNQWAPLCNEVAKLKLVKSQKGLKMFGATLGAASATSRKYFGKIVGVVGIEPTTCTV